MMQRLFGAQRQPRYKNVFMRVMDHDDLWDAALETAANYITCTLGIWTVIGRYNVKAQQQVRFGFGTAALPANQGRAYLALYDDTVTDSVLEEGKVRLAQRDSEDTISLKVKEWTTQELRFGATDPRMRQPIPEQLNFEKVGEDSFLEILFKPAATDGIAKVAIGTAAGLDIWNIPCTFYVL